MKMGTGRTARMKNHRSAGIVPTVLTVTVEGTVNGVEQTGIRTIGLLYCTERNNADDLFQEWLSTR